MLACRAAHMRINKPPHAVRVRNDSFVLLRRVSPGPSPRQGPVQPLVSSPPSCWGFSSSCLLGPW